MEYGRKFNKVYLNTKIIARVAIISSTLRRRVSWHRPWSSLQWQCRASSPGSRSGGPLHHNLGRDAAGEGETDEGAPGGMSANHLVLRESFLDSIPGTVASPRYGLVSQEIRREKLQTFFFYPSRTHFLRQYLIAAIGVVILIIGHQQKSGNPLWAAALSPKYPTTDYKLTTV